MYMKRVCGQQHKKLIKKEIIMEKKNKANQIDYDRKLMLAPLTRKYVNSFEFSAKNQVFLSSLEIIRISFTASFEANGLSIAVITELRKRAQILYFNNFSHLEWHAIHYLNDGQIHDNLEDLKMYVTFLENGKLKIDFCRAEDEDNTYPLISFLCDRVMDMSLKECREILEKEIK